MRALVLSGGGVKGAYQVGVLKHLLLEKNNVYDIYCGVSVGAINAAFLSMFRTGEEAVASKQLTKFWKELTPEKVYEPWFPLGKVHGAWKSSLYDSKPLQELLQTHISVDRLRKSGKRLCVGAVSLKTGVYEVFGEQADFIVDAVIASSAFPAFLRPGNFAGQLWTDGGVRSVTPIQAALDLGATEIDVVMCSPEKVEVTFPDDPNAFDVAMRSIDLMGDEIVRTDLKLARLYNELVKSGARPDKKHVELNIYRPDEVLTHDSLEFDPDKIAAMMALGYVDAGIKGR